MAFFSCSRRVLSACHPAPTTQNEANLTNATVNAYHCDDATIGFLGYKKDYFQSGYCDAGGSIGSTQYSACAAGFYGSTKDELFPCPPGFFCAAQATCFIVCPVGGLCPQSSYTAGGCRFPDWANPSGLKAKPPYVGQEGDPHCGGVSKLSLCPDGYYCENAAVMTICPGAPRRRPDRPAVPEALARSAPAPRCPLHPPPPPPPFCLSLLPLRR